MRCAFAAVNQGGTLREAAGIVPNQARGVHLRCDAGGQVLRVEGPHAPPNPHQFPHINYTTSSGLRGALEILGLDG